MARLAGILAALILMVLPFAVAHGQIFFGGLAVHGTAPESAAVEPIFEVNFEGGTSDCTDGGHCTDTTCAATDQAVIDCNATADPSPAGGAYAEFDGSDANTIQFQNKYSESELWFKFWWYPDNGVSGSAATLVGWFESGTTTPACGSSISTWFRGNASFSILQATMCGTSAQGTTPDYTDQTWQEMKIHLDVATGVQEWWLPGSDFTAACAATDCLSADGAEEAAPDDLAGFFLPNSTAWDLHRIDGIRVYDQDPDRPVGSTLFTMNFEGGTSDCDDGGHCSDSTCGAAALTTVNCNATADPSPAGGAYAEFDGTSSAETIDLDEKFAAHDVYIKYYANVTVGTFAQIPLPTIKDATNDPDCGVGFAAWLGSSGIWRLQSCGGTTVNTSAMSLDTWFQLKTRFNTKTGIVQTWEEGSDFTALCGSTDCTEATGTPEAAPAFLEGFLWRNATQSGSHRIDGIEVFDHNPDRALTDPIWTADFEGGASACTDTDHCSGQACATTDYSPNIDCNATTNVSPAGGAYALFDGSNTGEINFDDQFSMHELWMKFWWRPDIDTDPGYNMFIFQEGGGTPAALTCGATVIAPIDGSVGSGTTLRIRGCNTATTGTDPDYTDQTWQEIKAHININTGLMELWLPGSDFTAACGDTDCLSADGVEEAEPDPITGFLIDNRSNFDDFGIDSIRIYDRDPD